MNYRFGSNKLSVAELRKLIALREQRKLSAFNRFILWLHYLLMISLLIAILAKYISPVLFWFPAFFGLAFPFFFILNCIFVVYWIAQLKRTAIFGAVMLLLSIPTAYRYVQVSSPSPVTAQKILKVTSYNSMLFDLYNWSKNKETRSKIMTGLADINPDILCLQEYYTSEEKGDFDNTETLKRLLNTEFHHIEYTVTLRDFDHWGVATFSKYPIINQGKIVFNTTSNNICIFSDIVINRDTIRVYNVHLQSVNFSKHDNKFLEDMISEKNAQDEMANSTNILRRLKRAFVKRTKQVEMIVAHIKICPYKIIMCGDFNETAASYSYQKLSRNLCDAFIEKGLGFGRTYAGKWPKFRIDYILHDKQLHCSDYKRSDETYTDHYPITAYFDNITLGKSAPMTERR